MAINNYELMIENDKKGSLAIMKFPAMRSQFDNPNFKLKIKPKSFKVKLDVFDEPLQSEPRNIYTSTRTEIEDGQLFVAKLINNKLVCRPISDILVLRSDFTHLDIKEEVDPKEEVKPICVKFTAPGNNIGISAQQLESEDPNDEYQSTTYKPLFSHEAISMRENLFGKPLPKIKPDPDAVETIDKKTDLPDIKPKIENIELKNTSVKQKVKECLLKVKILSFEEAVQYTRGFGQVNNKDVLDALSELAVLVQGNWAIKSEILYGDSSERESTDVTGIPINLFTTARDYLLWLFTQDRTVGRLKYSRSVRIPDHDILELFNQLATYRNDLKKWEFKLPTDNEFLGKFPDVVNRQNTFWRVRRANKLAIFK